MGSRNVGRTLLCASALGLVAAAAPGVASADPYTVDCFHNASGSARSTHEIGEPEADGYCTPGEGAPNSFSIRIVEGEVGGGIAEPRGDHSTYPYVVYTATTTGYGGYSFYAVDDAGHQISASVDVLTNNVPATNGPPTCLGPQSGDGEAFAVGSEHFAAFCSDEEGESGPVSIQIVQRPSRGELRIDTSNPDGPTMYYRATCSGADDYSYTATDGVNTTEIYSASVTNAGSVPCTASSPSPSPAPAVPPRTAAPAATFSLKGVPSAATVDSGGNVTIPVTGTPGSAGSVSITADAPKGASASAVAKKKKAKKAKALSLGSKRFTVPASGVAKVKVKVSGKGLKALKKAKKLSAKVTVKTDKTTVTKKITLKAPKAKAKKKSKK